LTKKNDKLDEALKDIGRLEERIKWLQKSQVANVATSLGNSAIKWVALVLIFFIGYLAIKVLAGQHTVSQFYVSFLANLTADKTISYLIGAGGAIYGLRQKKLKDDTVKRLAPRNSELEYHIDPTRSSSELTETGGTRPEDE